MNQYNVFVMGYMDPKEFYDRWDSILEAFPELDIGGGPAEDKSGIMVLDIGFTGHEGDCVVMEQCLHNAYVGCPGFFIETEVSEVEYE